MATPQAVTAPLTRDAIFVTYELGADPGDAETTRETIAGIGDLVNAINSRAGAAGGDLTCVIGVGADAWPRLFPGHPIPAELHPFVELRGKYTAPATPGDILLHVRSNRLDLCFELLLQVAKRIGDAAAVIDETHGFFYFEDRDIIGFVDGTENPNGEQAVEATTVGAEDPDLAGGSYVHVQKYRHDLAGWHAVPVEEQERIVGREKLSNIELSEQAKPPYAHNKLTNIDKDGVEQKVVRHNMPFGSAARGEAGTYFIAYCRTPSITETMLEHMCLGDPPGTYDHLLDYSTALTGGLFFAPSIEFLDALAT